MTDVVVHVAVGDAKTETRFLETIDLFAKAQTFVEAEGDIALSDAPAIMVRTVPGGVVTRKAVTFQDRHSAAEFLALWRREQKRG